MFDIEAMMRDRNKKSDPKLEAARKKARRMFDDFLKKGAYVEVKVNGDLMPCVGIRRVGEDYLELDIFRTSHLTGGRITSKRLIHKSRIDLICTARVKGGDTESCPKTYAKFLKILGE
jgi:hypothetical protein